MESGPTSLLSELEKINSFEQVALEHHIEAVLFKYFKPFHTNQTFKKKWLMQWQYTNRLREELETLGHNISDKNKAHITVLKGMALTDLIYDDYGSRFMSDIDILIDPLDTELIFTSLKEMGYSQNKHKVWAGNHFKSEWIQSFDGFEINIEIHTSLFYHSKPFDLKYQDFSIRPFKRLDNDDLFIHLAGHLVFQHNFLKLYWLLDIILLIKRDDIKLDWNNIALKAKKNKVYRSIQMSLYTINKYFSSEVKIDHDILISFEIDQNKYWMSFLTQDLLLNPNHEGIKYWVTKHLSKDKISEAIYYDVVWLINKIKEKF